MRGVHWGANGVKVCGQSVLLQEPTTHDLQAVDCTRCLWKLLGETMMSSDRIAARIKVVTDRTEGLLEVEVLRDPSR